MFSGDPDGKTKAESIANSLASHNDHKSHGRHLPRGVIQSYGINVTELEADQTTQDLALSIFHATTHTFGATTCVKIIENHQGKAFMKQQQVMMPVGIPQPVVMPGGFPPPGIKIPPIPPMPPTLPAPDDQSNG
jgi:hypothetical protein